MVPATASPDDPELAQYWADRRRKRKPPMDNGTLRLLQQQRGRCPLCENYLLHADREPDTPREWEQWLTATRKAIIKYNLVAHGWKGPSNEFRLVHINCYRRATGASKESASLQALNRPWRLLEPYAATSGTYGSEGASAQQCVGATRLHS